MKGRVLPRHFNEKMAFRSIFIREIKQNKIYKLNLSYIEVVRRATLQIVDYGATQLVTATFV